MNGLEDFDVRAKRVLVRCDFNVPLDGKGDIQNDFRIREDLPTIRALMSRRARIILLSHLGNPEGKVVKSLSLRFLHKRLQELLKAPVTFARDCIGKSVEAATLELENSQILLAENLRFYKGELRGSIHFAKGLARLGDIFINDAFSVCHRAHASVSRLASLLPAGAGLALEKEVGVLKKFSAHPKHPFIVIVGGKKAKDKLSFIDKISTAADLVLLGNLLAKEVFREKIHFRHPHKVVVPLDGFPSEENALDLGFRTRELFKGYLKTAKKVFWTGPLGRVEDKRYAAGSLEIAKAIGESKAVAFGGGGDLSAFLEKYHVAKVFSHISTGGGATLAFLAGEELPGLAALGYYRSK